LIGKKQERDGTKKHRRRFDAKIGPAVRDTRDGHIERRSSEPAQASLISRRKGQRAGEISGTKERSRRTRENGKGRAVVANGLGKRKQEATLSLHGQTLEPGPSKKSALLEGLVGGEDGKPCQPAYVHR